MRKRKHRHLARLADKARLEQKVEKIMQNPQVTFGTAMDALLLFDPHLMDEITKMREKDAEKRKRNL
jgi:hypothetical protein